MKTARGPYGVAQQVPVEGMQYRRATVAAWLITAPRFHPSWSQYLLVVMHLRPEPGLPEPEFTLLDATHQLNVHALHALGGPSTVETIQAGRIPYLTPINICEQYIATDTEMTRVAELCAAGVVNGVLNPETGDAPARIREAWLGSITKTLAHIRGEIGRAYV